MVAMMGLVAAFAVWRTRQIHDGRGAAPDRGSVA
jgi:hypothetical protein